MGSKFLLLPQSSGSETFPTHGHVSWFSEDQLVICHTVGSITEYKQQSTVLRAVITKASQDVSLKFKY